jgi:hypothetical protein
MQLSFVRTVKKESGCEVQRIVEKDSGHPFNQAHIPLPEAALFWGRLCLWKTITNYSTKEVFFELSSQGRS